MIISNGELVVFLFLLSVSTAAQIKLGMWWQKNRNVPNGKVISWKGLQEGKVYEILVLLNLPARALVKDRRDPDFCTLFVKLPAKDSGSMREGTLFRVEDGSIVIHGYSPNVEIDNADEDVVAWDNGKKVN